MKNFDKFEFGTFLGIFALVLLFSIGVGQWFFIGEVGKRVVLQHACASACARLNSEIESQTGNVCLCKNMRVLRGDYGQLFLRGENK